MEEWENEEEEDLQSQKKEKKMIEKKEKIGGLSEDKEVDKYTKKEWEKEECEN